MRAVASALSRHATVRRLVYAVLIGLCGLGAVRLVQGAIIPAKAILAQHLLEHAFDRSLATHEPQKPWPWADMAPLARLRLPRLGISEIVLDTGSGQAMAFGPTLLPGGDRLGQSGTAVIAAHRDTHFRFLENVRIGDTITIRGLNGTRHHYRVTGTQIVRWDRFATRRTDTGQHLALATCYPFGVSSHGPLRYVVHAVAVRDRSSAKG